ncbi:MAG: cation:proton antiporter, partial [Anaerolineales bacterium]
PFGILNLILNFPPGVMIGLLLGWDPLAALLMGGVTYVSSSGVIAKTLNDLNWLGNRETPVILSTLVLEDLTMAIFLPLMVVLLVGGGVMSGVVSLTAAIATVAVVLVVAIRFGDIFSRSIADYADEDLLLTTLGLILVVAGIAQELQVSAAVGAFLVGIALSDPVVEHVQTLISPLRDLFAAIFFLFFGYQIDASAIPPVLGIAILLSIVTVATKFITGWWAARRSGIGTRGQWRAGVLMVPRGEFSIVIAGLAVTSNLNEPDLVPLAAAYVLIMVIVGTALARVVDPSVAAVLRWRKTRARKQAETAPQTAPAGDA